MPDLGDVVNRLVPGAPQLSTAFVVLLLLHVPAGLACVVTGPVAALSPKRGGSEDRHLFALGTLSFGVGTMG